MPDATELPRQFAELFLLAQGKGIAAGPVCRVDFQNFAGLGVFQNQPAQCGQFQFVPVGDLHGHDIVSPIGHAQRTSASGFGKMRRALSASENPKSPRRWRVRQDAHHKFQRVHQIRPAPFRFKK